MFDYDDNEVYTIVNTRACLDDQAFYPCGHTNYKGISTKHGKIQKLSRRVGRRIRIRKRIGDRNMEDKEFEVMDINSLACVCGYFTGDTDANNGYGCNHPEREQYEELYDDNGYTRRGFEDDDSKPKVRQGKCFASSCPIAFHCTTIEELKEHEPETAEEIICNNPDKSEDELDDIADAYELMVVKKENMKTHRR